VIAAAGVDTWSVAWYLQEGSPALKAAESLCDVPSAAGRLMKDKVAEHRVGYFPGSWMLYAEGHPGGEGLARSNELPDAFERLVGDLGDVGILPPRYDCRSLQVTPSEFRRVNGGVGFAGIRRLDSTCDVYFENGAEGLAALAGVASIPVPRVKTQIIREAGGRAVETVYLRGYSGKNVLGRWYDKGIETRELARGLRVRPEDQRRFPKTARPTVEAVSDPAVVRGLFVGRFQTLYQASKGVTVAGVPDLAFKLQQLQKEGSCSPGEAKRIAGALVLDAFGAYEGSERQLRRDRADARRLGLVLADGVVDEVDVDLGEVIEQALDSDCWGAQG